MCQSVFVFHTHIYSHIHIDSFHFSVACKIIKGSLCVILKTRKETKMKRRKDGTVAMPPHLLSNTKFVPEGSEREGKRGEYISLLMKEKFVQTEPVKYLQLPFSSNMGRQGEGEVVEDLNKVVENISEQHEKICFLHFCCSLVNFIYEYLLS